MYKGGTTPKTPVDRIIEKLIIKLSFKVANGVVSRWEAENILADQRAKLETDFILKQGIFAC